MRIKITLPVSIFFLILTGCNTSITIRTGHTPSFTASSMQNKKNLLLPLKTLPAGKVKISALSKSKLHRQMGEKLKTIIPLISDTTTLPLLKKELKKIPKTIPFLDALFQAGSAAGIDHLCLYSIHQKKKLPQSSREKDFDVPPNYEYILSLMILDCKKSIINYKSTIKTVSTRNGNNLTSLLLKLTKGL